MILQKKIELQRLIIDRYISVSYVTKHDQSSLPMLKVKISLWSCHCLMMSEIKSYADLISKGGSQSILPMSQDSAVSCFALRMTPFSQKF